MNSPAFKNVDTHFQNNLYSQVVSRQVHSGSFCEDNLVPSCIICYSLYLLDVVIKCNLSKIITINAMVVVL